MSLLDDESDQVGEEHDVAGRTDDDEELREVLAVSGPLFDRAMRRFSEGADVRTVAREARAPVVSISGLYVVYRWWNDPEMKTIPNVSRARDALMLGLFAGGATFESVVEQLGIERWDVRRVRTCFEHMTAIERSGRGEAERPYQVADIYVWLRNRKREGAQWARLLRLFAGEEHVECELMLEPTAPANIDVWEVARHLVWSVQDYAGPRGGRWRLEVSTAWRQQPFCTIGLFEGRESPRPLRRWSAKLPTLLQVTSVRRV